MTQNLIYHWKIPQISKYVGLFSGLFLLRKISQCPTSSMGQKPGFQKSRSKSGECGWWDPTIHCANFKSLIPPVSLSRLWLYWACLNPELYRVYYTQFAEVKEEGVIWLSWEAESIFLLHSGALAPLPFFF